MDTADKSGHNYNRLIVILKGTSEGMAFEVDPIGFRYMMYTAHENSGDQRVDEFREPLGWGITLYTLCHYSTGTVVLGESHVLWKF